MLYPVANKFRSKSDLSGFWEFKIDVEKKGEFEGWYQGFKSQLDIAVPGSWNEQLEEAGLLHYTGTAWYQKEIFIPEYFSASKIWLRFGSSDYFSRIWINGKLLGENNEGFLPFEFEITDFVKPGEKAFVIVSVNNELSHQSIPQGINSADYMKEGRAREETYPPARFDFSPFGGIHRPVLIYTTPLNYISSIKVDTLIQGKNSANIIVNTNVIDDEPCVIKSELIFEDKIISQAEAVCNSHCKFTLPVENARFWSCSNPDLYTLNLKLLRSGLLADEYELNIGIREIKIEDNKLLLNGEELYLKGFGKHEDFWVIGKGVMPSLIVKDFMIMKWINANSFRTSHYPYSEEIMNFADKKGFLVIDEVPAVSLDFCKITDKTLANHKRFIKKLIQRDYNHPSVIMWAAGNEPNIVGKKVYYEGSGRKYWKSIFSYVRELDPTRPVTVPNCQKAGLEDPVFEFSDVLSVNRYYGWYENPGRLEIAVKIFEEELERLFSKYKKPVLISEFGADTMPGLHSTSDQMFTEEYQVKLISLFIKMFRSKKYIIGEHVWNFADFRTPMHFRRVVLNLKGVFDRSRNPKSAAFSLREIWKS